MKNIWSWLFGLYGIFYVFLYVGYFIIIRLAHSSYNIVSVTAIIFPFLLLLAFQLALWKASDDNFGGIGDYKYKFISTMLVAGFLPICCGIMLGINEYKSHFNIDRWLSDESSRVHMVDNLIKEYNLVKMTKDEVTVLLGTATDTNSFKEKDNIVYYLGDERGLIPIDSEWLILEFDENEKVRSYEIKSD